MEIKVKNATIGYSHPVFIIAEGGDNHMGSIDDALEMCLRAKLAGADAIKFQHHLPYEEMLEDVPMSDNFETPLYDFLVKNALKLEDHVVLQDYCEKIGIKYMCTPFSYKAAVELKSIGLDIFKIGSGEMTDVPSLLKIAALGNPMIVSTGMSTYEEIGRTYNALIEYGVQLALTNCVSEYPPKYEDVNFGVVSELKQRFPKAIIGHSDHTPDIYTCIAAVVHKPAIIEKHVILDKRTPGPDQSVSLDFEDLRLLCDGIRKVEAAMGSEKKIHQKEEQIREWAFRSIVSTRSIAKGEVIRDDMIWTKRPGTGIPSHQMDLVIGKIAKRNIENNILLSWDDFE
jgi:N,N'-diacetyllegionaminate synthase